VILKEVYLLSVKVEVKKVRYIVNIFLLSLFILACSDDQIIQLPSNNVSKETEWVKTFGGSKNEQAKSIVKTDDGGYAVLGFTQSNDGDVSDKPGVSFDYWLMKFGANDELQWDKTYGGTLDDKGTKLIQTQDGGYVIVGYSQSNDEDATQNAGSHDFWMVKLNSSGTVLWEKSLGYVGLDKALSVIQVSDGGYVVTGIIDVTASGGAGNSKAVMHAGGDFWAVKLNANGDTLWTKYFGGGLSEIPNDLIETQDNGFILVGTSDSADVDISNNKGGYDFWLVKIDANGVLVWEKSFGGSEIDEAYAITATEDGNYVVVGDTRSVNVDVSQNSGSADLWLIKITPSGNLIWEKTFGGISFDAGRSVAKTEDNGFLIAGSSRSVEGNLTVNNGQNDAWVMKVSSSGVLEWQKTVGGSQIDFAYGAVELNDKKVVLVGESSSSDFDIIENKGFTDLLIAKIK